LGEEFKSILNELYNFGEYYKEHMPEETT